MKRACQGLNAKGEPCKSTGVRADGYCAAHTTLVPAEQRFGHPQQAREAASGVQRRYPRLRETVERKIEEQAERIVEAGLEALDATRLTVSEDGEVHVSADYLTRLRAHDTLISRALGKPAQSIDVSSESRGVIVHLDATDPETREALHGLLRRRPVELAA